jgi:ribonuclease Z
VYLLADFCFKEKERLRNIRKDVIEYYQIQSGYSSDKTGRGLYNHEGLQIPNEKLTTHSHSAKSYAYCSDTAYLEDIIPYITGVDLLYHESTYAEEDAARAKETLHSTSIDAATIAQKANAQKLVIGHFLRAIRMKRSL